MEVGWCNEIREEFGEGMGMAEGKLGRHRKKTAEGYQVSMGVRNSGL